MSQLESDHAPVEWIDYLRQPNHYRPLYKAGRRLSRILPSADGFRRHLFATTASCFFTGDSRVTEQPLLTLMNIVSIREHNRVAGQLPWLNLDKPDVVPGSPWHCYPTPIGCLTFSLMRALDTLIWHLSPIKWRGFMGHGALPVQRKT